MKDWFPLTSYDFYAYLTAGMVVLVAFDRAFLGSVLANQTEWKLPVVVFWAAMAYLTGHLIAIPSSGILEHWLARRVLRDPSAVILGLQAQRRQDRCFGTLAGAREYEPFPADYRATILPKIAHLLKVQENEIQADAAFQCAFPHARSMSDAAIRMDNFLNQYGLCRNVSFASGLAALFLTCLAVRSGQRLDAWLAVAAAVLSLGLFVRFIKFYAAYTREVFRAFDKSYVLSPAAEG